VFTADFTADFSPLCHVKTLKNLGEFEAKIRGWEQGNRFGKKSNAVLVEIVPELRISRIFFRLGRIVHFVLATEDSVFSFLGRMSLA